MPDRIVVLVRRVPDPKRISVDRKTGRLLTAHIPHILNPVDLSAIELALRAREKMGGEVVAVSIDEPAAEFEMREALAMGCDRAVLLSDPAFASTDTLAQARIFRAALESLIQARIVFAASRSIDHTWSTVGPQLSYLLGWPLIIEAESVEITSAGLAAVAHTGAFRARVEAPLPALVTVARGVVRPRTPTAWGVAEAFDEKKVEVKGLSDLGLDPTTTAQLAPRTKVLRVLAQGEGRARRRIEGDPAEVGRILARRLVDQGWAGRRP